MASIRWARVWPALVAGLCWGCGAHTAQTGEPSPQAAQAAGAEAEAAGIMRYLVTNEVIEHANCTVAADVCATGSANHVRVFAKHKGEGDAVMVIPSLGRGVEDYTELFDSNLTTRLVDAGFQVVLIQPRGIGQSAGNLQPEDVELADLVDDLKSTLDAMGLAQVHVVGHGFGNRVARAFTRKHPSHVKGLALLGAGTGFEMTPEAKGCLEGSFDMSLPDAERLERVGCALFAEGNDPAIWLEGWYPELAAAQMHAAQSADPADYEDAGGKPFLILQGAEDFVAPPAQAGRALKAKLGDQVTYEEVPHAGHAMAPERPEAIADALIAYFQKPPAK